MAGTSLPLALLSANQQDGVGPARPFKDLRLNEPLSSSPASLDYHMRQASATLQDTGSQTFDHALPSGSVEQRGQDVPCIPEELSHLQQDTLTFLRVLVPSSKLSQISAELRIPSLVYQKLYDLASHRGITGIRLEKKKQEWITAWTDSFKRERRRYFSIRRLGVAFAWYMACKTRAEAVQAGARVRLAPGNRSAL